MEKKYEKEICWNITTRCNQKCRYCHRFLNLPDLPIEENKKILNNLIDSKVTSITWTGGEALLYDGLTELLKISYSSGIKNKLISNGKILDVNKINEIGKYLDSITLSIDSVDNLINEKIGRGYNHFNNIQKLLEYLNNTDINIRINSVVCNYNKNNFEDLIAFLNNYNIYSWRLFKFMPLRENAIINKDDFDISLNEYNKVLNKVYNESNIKNIDFRVEEDMEKKYILLLADGSIVITQDGVDKKIGNALTDLITEE